jgi:hypothetical protein
MTLHKPTDDSSALKVANYCLAFIDLLGQCNAAQGQSLVPTITSDEEKQAFMAILRSSVGQIAGLQDSAEQMFRAMERVTSSDLRERLPNSKKSTWDQSRRTRVVTQHWSDGLAMFVSLGESSIKCKVSGIYRLLVTCGALCFIGLAKRQPLRGAVEIAWGVELNPGEIYGPVVARAYELESQIAQYPRIIIGPEVVNFLQQYAKPHGCDDFSRIDQAMAQVCLGMLWRDADGYNVLHYLGLGFRDAVTAGQHEDLYRRAKRFVVDQHEEHLKAANQKLTARYARLLRYFDTYPPART